MTRHSLLFPAMAMLAFTVCIGVSPLRAGTLPGEEEVCGDYGTTVIFAESPAAAARQALKEEKLVFVLHVSGNFETSAFT